MGFTLDSRIEDMTMVDPSVHFRKKHRDKAKVVYSERSSESSNA